MKTVLLVVLLLGSLAVLGLACWFCGEMLALAAASLWDGEE